jgi:hypothetical protein
MNLNSELRINPHRVDHGCQHACLLLPMATKGTVIEQDKQAEDPVFPASGAGAKGRGESW